MKQVLVVEDSKSMRHALRLLFRGEQHFAVCGEAVDGLDAIEKAEQLYPDVILLDLAMPKLNGAEVATILRQKNPNAKIVLFTMYGDFIGDHLAAAIGVDDVVSKSDGWIHLLDCIYRLSGERHLAIVAPPSKGGIS